MWMNYASLNVYTAFYSSPKRPLIDPWPSQTGMKNSRSREKAKLLLLQCRERLMQRENHQYHDHRANQVLPMSMNRTNPIAAPAATPPTQHICTPPQIAAITLARPDQPRTTQVLTYPNTSRVIAITPILQYSAAIICETMKYGISGINPPIKYPSARVMAEVHAWLQSGAVSR